MAEVLLAIRSRKHLEQGYQGYSGKCIATCSRGRFLHARRVNSDRATDVNPLQCLPGIRLSLALGSEAACHMGPRVKVFDPVKVGGWMVLEKMLRWSIHPRLRARCLRLLGATIGERVRIYETMLVQILEGFSHLTIGDDSSIGPGGMIDLTGPVEIGSHTALAPGCVLMTHSDPGSRIGSRLCNVYPRTVAGIRIGDHVWIGAHTLILAGVTIGDGTVIGAGSLVAKDIPSGVVAYGRPAVPVRSLAHVTSA